MKKYNILAVVITYNGIKWIDNCIKSLIKKSYLSQIIVIDNNSADGTALYIEKNFPDLHLIPLKNNIGFGPANNIGLTHAMSHHADYVFLLNQDAWIESDTIRSLINAHQHDDRYGVISPLHFNGAGTHLDHLFYSYLVEKMVDSRTFFSNLLLNKKLEYPYATNFVNAAAWLITSEAIKRVGGFDPLFLHWGEDNNYLDRLKFHNLKAGICPATKIYHDREDSLNDRSLFFEEYDLRKRMRSILDPGKNIRMRDIKKQIYREVLGHLLKLKFKKVRKLIKTHLRITAQKNEILLRDALYKQTYCFLGENFDESRFQ